MVRSEALDEARRMAPVMASLKGGPIQGWIRRLFVERMREDRLHGRSRVVSFIPLARIAEPALQSQSSLDALIEAERASVVRDAMSRLTAGQREVLVGCFWNGETNRATARRLGIPESTASLRRKTAIKRLRRDLTRSVPLCLLLTIGLAIPARAVPHLIHGIQGVHGSMWTLASSDTLAGRDWLSPGGGLAFDVYGPGRYRVAWVADPGGGPADVQDPPIPPTLPPSSGSSPCGHMGLEAIGFGLLICLRKRQREKR